MTNTFMQNLVGLCGMKLYINNKGACKDLSQVILILYVLAQLDQMLFPVV